MSIGIFCAAYNTTEEQWRRLVASLDAQTHQYWHLYVVHDGITPPIWMQDSGRISVGRQPHSGIIGAVKRQAALWAADDPLIDVLVEMDHDDELTPNCLADIVAAFEAYPECGFAYTDCAEVMPDGSPALYNDGWGMGAGSYRWEQPQLGHGWLAVTNYPHTSKATIGDITGMPNHARAWRTTTYMHIGGHDPTRAQCDDYDLMLRTLAVTPFVHICKLGYLQHMADESATNARRGLIRAAVPEVYAQHADKLAGIDWRVHVTRQWPPNGFSTRRRMLDIGGGRRPYPGYDQSIDLVHGDDVRFGLTFADQSIDVIRASHVLEHFDPCASWCNRHIATPSVESLCVVGVMNEMWRVLKPGGSLHLIVPSADGSGGVSDPTHRNFWNMRTLQYYAGGLREFLPQAKPWVWMHAVEYDSYVKVIEAHFVKPEA